MKLEERDFIRLKDYIKKNYAIDLAKKITLIEGRMGNLILQKGFKDFASYIDYALGNPEEETVLVSRLSTNFTYFMREEQHYKFMTEQMLPEWIPKIRDRDLRIWSAGCSSGDEAYTTAMVITDYLGSAAPQWDYTILATDISEKVLALARQAVYPQEQTSRLPESYQRRFFRQVEPGVVQVTDDMRKQVVFGNFNLMEPAFNFKKKFHLIFCRNVMIYFDNHTRKAIAEKFYDCLHPGGYLFIGLSETMSNLKTRFEYVKPAIYRKI